MKDYTIEAIKFQFLPTIENYFGPTRFSNKNELLKACKELQKNNPNLFDYPGQSIYKCSPDYAFSTGESVIKAKNGNLIIRKDKTIYGKA